jgi:signal peptidase I
MEMTSNTKSPFTRPTKASCSNLPFTRRSPIGEAEPDGQLAPLPLRKEALSLLLKVAVISGIAALLFTFVYGLDRNADPDMAPAVKDGDLVAFYRLDKDYAAGDLLVLSYKGKRQVRRVVAVAGDTVDITEEGLLVNGALQQEPEIYEPTMRYEQGIPLPLTLGEGETFVLGDSRGDATDSRVYGPVAEEGTLGAVIAVMRRRNL